MDRKRTALSVLRDGAILGLVSIAFGCAHGTPKSSPNSAALNQNPPIAPNALNTPPPKPVVATPPPSTPKPVKHASDAPSLWPVLDNSERVILSSYGYRGGRRGGPGAFHRAVDIRAAMNTPVVATADGVVKELSNGGGYGKMIVVDHGNGFSTAYAHLNEFKVAQGQHVQKGEVIALSGRTGNATCPHVHYEVRKDTAAVNPVDFLPMESVHIEQLASLTPPPPPIAAKSAAPAAKTVQKKGPAPKAAARSGKPSASTGSKKAQPAMARKSSAARKPVAASTKSSGAKAKSTTTTAKAAGSAKANTTAKAATVAKPVAAPAKATATSHAKPAPKPASVKSASTAKPAPSKKPVAKSAPTVAKPTTPIKTGAETKTASNQ